MLTCSRLVILAFALVGSSKAFLLSPMHNGHLNSRVMPPRCHQRLSMAASSDLASLKIQNAAALAALADKTKDVRGEKEDETWLLPQLLAGGDPEATVREAMAWRKGDGKAIIEAAKAAVEAATAGGSWDNAPVLSGAPHSAIIAKYITPKSAMTVTTKDGDLCYIIRAATIDDKGLMAAATQEQVVDFFLYSKEVNAIVANARTRATGRLTKVVTANDLAGINLLGDATFRKALSASSKVANAAGYSALAGPTLLLNLPSLLGALVTLFKPLFPKPVQAKLKFAQGPLKGVSDLTELKGDAKAKFLVDIDQLLNS